MLAAANRSAIAQLRRQELLTATPAQLTVKLFHRLLLDLNRAAVDLAAGNTGQASVNLVHAQAIMTELEATLDPTAWAGAEDLKLVDYCATNCLYRFDQALLGVLRNFPQRWAAWLTTAGSSRHI